MIKVTGAKVVSVGFDSCDALGILIVANFIRQPVLVYRIKG